MPEAGATEGTPDAGSADAAPAVGSTGAAPAVGTTDQVLAIVRYEAGKRARGTLVLVGLLVALAALDLAFFPSMQASGVDIDAYFESLPPAMQEAFGGVGLGTVEGFLVAEFYQFAWVLALGMYLAYRAGGLLAGDVERDRMDLLLAAPVSRRAVVLGKFLSLVPLVVLANVVIPVVIYAGVAVIDESISAADLAAVHLLSFPYLLACAALGLLLSAVVSKADLGQRAGLGIVFGMFLVESLTTGTDYEWVGALTLPRYYDSAPILTASEYDLGGAAILLGVATVALALGSWGFGRRDV